MFCVSSRLGFWAKELAPNRWWGGIAIWSAATAATAATTGFASILGARLVMGASEATTFPACGRVIRDWFPEKERGMVTTLFNGGSSAGPVVGAIAAAALVSSFGCDRTLSSAAIQAGKRRNFIASMALLSMMIVFASGVKELWQLLVILVLVLTGSTTGAGLNFTLASDLLRSPRDVSRVIAITALGGNLFGLIAPIITGYIVAGSGGYAWAFRIAAALLLCGAVATLLMTRKAINPQYGSVMALKQIVRTTF